VQKGSAENSFNFHSNKTLSTMADEQHPAPAPDAPWLVLQKKIFARYVTQQLRKGGIKDPVKDVINDFKDGVLLIQLVEVMSGKSFGQKLKPATARIQQIDNLNKALTFVRDQGIKTKASAEDIADGKEIFVLGLVFAVIIKYMKLDEEDSGSSDVKEALLLWLKNKTAGYRDVSIDNFTKSFQDGLAFNALIHKMRPKLIPYDSLDKANKIHNLKLALDTAAKFCNVEKYLEPEDIANLDEIGMIVYLYDWYYGVSLLQKQDVAARRIGKLADMTKLHDQMKADYKAGSEALAMWIDEKIKYTSDRTIDNTMSGIRKRLQAFYDYKNNERGPQIVKNLDLAALFDNLALRLKNNKRPPFQTQFPPETLDHKFVALDESEAAYSKHLHTELERQVRLDNLGKRFKKDSDSLAAYIQEKLAYANKAESIDSIESANFYLEEHAIQAKEIELTKSTRLVHLNNVLTELGNEKYEFLGELKNSYNSQTQSFASLEAAATKKQQTLQAELEKQKKINDDLCKEFAQAVKAFTDYLSDKKTKVGDKNAELHTLLDLVNKLIKDTSEPDKLLAAIQSAAAKVDARQITINPYTNVTAEDTKAQNYQFTLLLNKKKEVLEAEIESSKRAGLTEEQMKEIEDNFNYFDRNPKNGTLDRRELRSCLQSLGDDATPQAAVEILAQYGQPADGKLSKENFTKFMIVKLGDTNTKEEIIQGFKYLSLDKDTILAEQLEVVVNDLTFKDHHVAYLKKEMKSSGNSYDFLTWTEEVFAR